MYQTLLTRRYLFSKVMPLLAAAAVMLCTAMVLVTWSIMGGFLSMLIGTGRTLAGDVAISWPNTGFAHYADLVDRLRTDPMIAGAAPVIETFGLVGLPDGRNETVIIRGVDGPSYASVTEYANILWWKPLDKPLPKDTLREDVRLTPLTRTSWRQIYENGLTLTRPDPVTGAPRPAVVAGIEATGFNERLIEGFYAPRAVNKRTSTGRFELIDTFMPTTGEVTINVLPLDTRGRVIETASRVFPVANEFQSGLFEIDEKVILVQLDALQDMLKMGAARRLVDDPDPSAAPTLQPAAEPDDDAFTSEPARRLVDDPARVTHVLVRGAGPMPSTPDAERLKARVRAIYEGFANDHPGAVPDVFSIRIQTWEDQNRTMIQAVRKETAVVLFVFSFISLTAVFLTLAIFWSMISEKTRDIGVLRALGAGRAGVAGLWIGYGLVIGVVGSLLGLALAYAIVLNINPIHDWLGRQLGIVIWDPRIYYFVKIPSRVEPDKALIVLVGGILSCAVGAAWPAIRAATMHPVRALRFE